jgi:DNA-binding XRE family transcriptional regulator
MTDNQQIKIIGANIRQARLAANFTQECLAELIGTSWQTISYIENGRYFCSVLNFAHIAQALTVSADSLLVGLPAPDHQRVERIKKAMKRRRKPKTPRTKPTKGR